MRSIRQKLMMTLCAALACATLMTAFSASSANALTPAQSTSTGTVNTLLGDVNNFWRTNFSNWGWSSYYRTPNVWFYNSTISACGTTLSANNSFACNGYYIGNIYIGTGWTQNLLYNYGDYAPGVILAHEWGHEIMYDLRWTSRSGTIGSELFADCLAGMYTRYGLTVSYRLNNSDYTEGFNTLWGIAGGDQYVKIKIIVPAASDARSRELIEELARLHPQQVRSGPPWD